MTYFCLLSLKSQHSDWSEITCHNSLHWTVTKRGHSAVWTPAAMSPHSENNNTMQHKATFCDQLKPNTKKTHWRALQRFYSIVMINESNKLKTQRRLQRTAVSVITHATHAFTLLRENFNATLNATLGPNAQNSTHASNARDIVTQPGHRQDSRGHSATQWKVDKPDDAHTQH